MTKDWTPNCPPFESQYSALNKIDAFDCVEQSLVHIIYMLTGFRASARALGCLVKVTPDGSSKAEALEAIKRYGLIPYELWPTPDTFTWESYYADIPNEVLNAAIPTFITEIPFDLSLSPGWTQIHYPTTGTNHFVAQINETHFFDSEPYGPIKPITYGNAVLISHSGIALQGDFFVKSAGFSAAQFAVFSPEVQAAIKFNDNGGKNVIINGRIVSKDPVFIHNP